MVLLAGCAREDRPSGDSAPRSGYADPGLPQPLDAGGAVTGMPAQPGPGDVPLGGEQPSPEIAGDGLRPLEDNPETGLLPSLEPPTAMSAESVPEPTPDDAVALVRSYYTAINALDYPRAYALWSDGGRSSGQSPGQFAAAFAQTSTVMVDIGEPSSAQAAGDGRSIEVPVSVRAQQTDGSMLRYEGRYVLRSAGVDGTGRRAWRIASTDLRETVSP